METAKKVGGDPVHREFGMCWTPNQDFIYISRRFYSHWKDEIAGNGILVVDPNGNTSSLTVGLKQGKPAFTNGVQALADFYSLHDKSCLHFKYNEHLTFQLRIFHNDGNEIEYPPEVINLDTDSEDDYDHDNNWEKVVTKRIAAGTNPLHLPARVAGRLVDSGNTTLHVMVLNTNLAVDCEIRPSSRYKNEAYLCLGWYGLCKDLKMSPGDKLLFTFLPTEQRLAMSVLRNN